MWSSSKISNEFLHTGRDCSEGNPPGTIRAAVVRTLGISLDPYLNPPDTLHVTVYHLGRPEKPEWHRPITEQEMAAEQAQVTSDSDNGKLCDINVSFRIQPLICLYCIFLFLV